MRRALALGVVTGVAWVVACGDAGSGSSGPPPPNGPGSVSNGSGTNNQAPSTQSPQDAGVDRGPDFRDPRATDGACSAPNVVCDNACISINNDVDHCGSCTNACQGPGTLCAGGACACGANNEMYCMDDQGTGCRDVKSDVNNCGACGNVCDPNVYDRCENGVCLEPE